MLRWFVFFFLFFVRIFSINAHQYDLSVCMIFRDEAPYLKEWIEFHRIVGVQHFYLYSHNSTDNYKEVLSPYIESDLVELVEYSDPIDHHRSFYHYQMSAYNDGLVKNKGVSKWVAFLDSDEFLFPVEHFSLVNFLKEYEDCVGVAVNWLMYGTSYAPCIEEEQLMTELLTLRSSVNFVANQHVKSIVRPEFVSHFSNPHFAIYMYGGQQVNSNKEQFIGPFNPLVLVDKIRINHYWTRDENFWKTQKIPRCIKRGISTTNLNWYYVELNKERDTAIYKYLPYLKDAMK